MIDSTKVQYIQYFPIVFTIVYNTMLDELLNIKLFLFLSINNLS